MPSVTVNNVKINYIEQGTGDEVIVFAHGFAQGVGAWKEILELIPKEYHAYALDQRGHGQSEKPGSYDLARFAEDICAFSQELGIGKFTYVGHSMGGPIGIKLALEHPEVLKCMVLIAPAPAHGWEGTPDVVAMMQFMGFADVTTAVKSMFGSTEMIRGFLLASLFGTPPSEERMNEFLDYALAMDPRAIDGCFAWITSPNLEPRLGQIRVPTLIVAAGKDLMPVDALRRTANGIPGCHLEVFEENGHQLHNESPQRFVRLLTSFVKEVSRG